DDEAILNSFRKLTLSDKERAAIAALIARFRDESFRVREQAAHDVIGWGPRAAGLLRRAARSTEPETAARARSCLHTVLKGSTSSLLIDAVRRLENRQPAGTVTVLLAYLPDAENEALAGALQSALNTAATRGDKVKEEIVKALADPLPERRAAAGVALC